MSRLLINEPPLQVLPSLAKEIGLNEAIMLQQMHYWLLKSANEFTGVKWFYKTLEEWQTEFPFWSAMTIRRTLGSLEKQKIIKIGNFNKKKFDKTKWFTIDYQRVNRRCVQIVQMDVFNLNRPIPENTQRVLQRIIMSQRRNRVRLYGLMRLNISLII